MILNTNNLSVDQLLKVFQYSEHTSLSEAIILSALSINKWTSYLPVTEYRENVFSVLWKQQFHHGNSTNWTPQFRSELNQGENRLAFRVFESPNPEKKGWEYRLKKLSDLNAADLKIVKELKRKLSNIEKGATLLDSNDEEIFQNSVQIVSPIELPSGKIKKPAKKKANKTNRYARDPRVSKNALIISKYKCQYNNGHKTFYIPSTENHFMEAHHIIPMKYQDDFPYSIDVQENVISLCPNCHRKIHKANVKAKKEMLEKVFTEKRKESLISRGIDITLVQLLTCYKNIKRS